MTKDQQIRIDIQRDGSYLLYLIIIGFAFNRSAMSVLTSWDQVRIQRSLWWLEDAEYVVCRRGEYYATADGHDYLSAARRSPYLGDAVQFREEVLTGMTGQGKESVLENAALPSATPPPPQIPTPEDIISVQEMKLRARRQASRSLGLSEEDFDAGCINGSIHVCNGGGRTHVGIFDRKGTGWQYLCRKCRKTMRREKNKR